MNTSGLDLSAIPGLGPARRAALAAAGVQDLRGLLAMRVAELAAIRGIGIWQARRIREFLRQRGLLVELEEEDGSTVMLVQPHTTAEARVVNDIVHALEVQAETEAQLQQEVEQLSEAVASVHGDGTTRDGNGATAVKIPVHREGADAPAGDIAGDTTSGDPAGTALPEEGEAAQPEEWTHPEAGPLGAANRDDDEEDDEDADDEDDELPAGDVTGAREALRAQRDQLPDVALVLMDAIRQAAVTKQLTRQITRLLITSGEFVSAQRPLNAEAYLRAQTLVADAERLLHRAVEKATFDQDAQKELASRLRKRRKELEALLESG